MDNETLNKLHNTQLEILREIDRVCKLHNISYFLDSGSALGAIRHQGFIPWDDDIDIAMLREEYDRFCEIAPKALNDNFFFQSILTDRFYNKLHVKIRKNNTKFIEKLGGNPNMHNGIFVDIVPFDKVPSRFAKIFSWLAFTYQRMFVYRYEKDSLKPNAVKNFLSELFTGKNTLKRYNRICKLFSTMKCDYSYVAFDYPDYQRFVFPANIFSNIVNVTFEGLPYPVVKGYDDYLRIMYGDYMKLPPEEDRRTHDVIDLKL